MHAAVAALGDGRPIHRRDVHVEAGLAHALQHTALHLGHAEVTRQQWERGFGATS